MFYDDLFGPLGRIIFIGIGAGTLFVTFVVILCFFAPGCYAYECLKRRKKSNEASNPLRYNGQTNENIKLGGVSYRSWRLGSLYENASEVVESPRNSLNSKTRPVECIEMASRVNRIHAEKQKSENRPKEFLTQLTMSLQYLPPIDDNITGKIVIGIEAVSNVPPKQYNCTFEPYIALNIIKQSWTNRRQELHSFRTRGIRNTASPIYGETFVVADVKSYEAKEWILDIAAYDHDQYANHTELSNLRVPLKDVKKIFHSPEIHLFNYRMKPSNREFGNILLGISYLPTAQRLSINVMKLRDLKFTRTIKSIQEFNPYVRILMLNGKTGRKIKKKKTKFLHSVIHPEFNETLTFELSFNHLETVQFLIVLCSNRVIKERVGTDHPSDSEDSVHSYKKSKDVFIGKVALGKSVRGLQERLHWFSVLQNPRKLVTVWHTLK